MVKFKTTLISTLSYLILITTLIIMGYCVVNEIKMAFSINNYRYNTSQKTGIVEDVTSYSQNLIGGKNVYYIDVKTKNGYNEDITISKQVSYLESQNIKKNDTYTFEESDIVSLSKLSYSKVFTQYRDYLYTTPLLLLIPFVTTIALCGSKDKYKNTIEHVTTILGIVGAIYVIYVMAQFICIY